MAGYLSEASRPEYDSREVENAFNSVIELMCIHHDRDNGFELGKFASHLPNAHSPKTALHDQITSLQCPGLSLRHFGHLNIGKSSRVQAEHESAALLARPITVQIDPSHEADDSSISIEDLPRALMNNIYESFAILVDSRLRVYSKIFLRHLASLVAKQADAFGILQMGQKLETLHDIGGQITAVSVKVDAELDNTDVDEVSPGVFKQAFRLDAVMELDVPSPTGPSRTFAVRQNARGYLTGMFSVTSFEVVHALIGYFSRMLITTLCS